MARLRIAAALVLLAIAAQAGDDARKPRLSLDYLRVGMTVEAEGRFERGRLLARTIEVENASTHVTLEGVVDFFEPVRGGIGGVSFRVDPGAEIEAAPEPGAWVKAKCKRRDGVLVLRRLSLRRRHKGDPEQVRGPVTAVDVAGGKLEIGGITVLFDPSVEVLWDVDGEEPPGAPGAQRRPGSADEEERRPSKQLSVGRLTVGGEVQYELELRRNLDLRAASRRDRLVHEISSQLELTYDLGRRGFAFGQLGLERKFVGFDQDRDLEFGTELDVDEAYVMLDLFDLTDGLRVQVGRQDFDHGREWLMDEELDAVRVYWDLGDVDLQASVSAVLVDAGRQEGVVNVLLAAEWEPDDDLELFFYGLHRSGGNVLDLERTHLGFSVEAEREHTTLWADLAFVTGDERGFAVEGFGLDVLVLREFADAPLRPYAYAGVAYGSGDPDVTNGREQGFRQSGFQDNNMRLLGSASFRYLGELVRPELSNLWVFTAGVGIRPAERLSLDLVYHHYEQDVAAPFLKDTRLRLDPNGRDTNLGDGLDLVCGVEHFEPLEIELVLGYFRPGGAFDSRDDAFFLLLQIEWNF